MPVNKKQLMRLIRLVALLKENRYPNCSSIAASLRKADLEENLNLACTEKTIYRDIQTLKNDFDAPVEFSKIWNGYFLTNKDWTFTCPQIYDDSEMLAAVLGARVAEHIFPEVMQKQIRDAVDYLLTYNNPDFLDKTRIDSLVVLPGNKARIDAKIFMPLFYAWQNHEVCRITYKDSNGKSEERDFEPHALIFYDGCWYSKGICHTRKQMRTLVLPRMESVVPTGKCFTPSEKIVKTANEDGIFDPEMVSDVRVICDEYLANIIQTRLLHQDQVILPLPDGGCELHVKTMSKYRLSTWIMHQCGRASLRKPEHMIAEIKQFAMMIMKSHPMEDD